MQNEEVDSLFRNPAGPLWFRAPRRCDAREHPVVSSTPVMRRVPSPDTVEAVARDLHALTNYCVDALRPDAGPLVLAQIRMYARPLTASGFGSMTTRHHVHELLKRAAILCSPRRWTYLGAAYHEQRVQETLVGLQRSFDRDRISAANRRALDTHRRGPATQRATEHATSRSLER